MGAFFFFNQLVDSQNHLKTSPRGHYDGSFSVFSEFKKKKKEKIINKDGQLLNRMMGFQTRFLLLLHESPVVSTELPLTLEYVYLKFIDQADEKTSPSLLCNLSDGLADAQPTPSSITLIPSAPLANAAPGICASVRSPWCTVSDIWPC